MRWLEFLIGCQGTFSSRKGCICARIRPPAHPHLHFLFLPHPLERCVLSDFGAHPFRAMARCLTPINPNKGPTRRPASPTDLASARSVFWKLVRPVRPAKPGSPVPRRDHRPSERIESVALALRRACRLDVSISDTCERNSTPV